MQNINAQSVKVGDTLIKNFVMKRAVITLCGTLIDENTKPVQGVIRLENSQTNKVIDSIKTSADGKYCFELPENTALRFNAKIQDFIVQPIEFNSATMKKGEQNIINYQVMSIDHAIAQAQHSSYRISFLNLAKRILLRQVHPNCNVCMISCVSIQKSE
jgi:hypothetical protein